jgi:formate dehydrogenase subunit gamma
VSVQWDEAEAGDIVRRHEGREGRLLPILHDIQASFGCVPEPAIPFLARALNVSRAEVHGVVSFYHDFRDRPAGRHVLKICRAEACQAMDGEAWARRLLARLGLEWGGTTPDGAVTVEAVYCLGLCASAPAALLDGAPMARLGDDSVREIVREVTR